MTKAEIRKALWEQAEKDVAEGKPVSAFYDIDIEGIDRRERYRAIYSAAHKHYLTRHEEETQTAEDVDLIERNLAKLAIDVQNASNLSGVVNSFSGVTEKLWRVARARGKGTEWVNTHPVCILFIDKLSSLAGVQNDRMRIMEAYDEAHQLAEEEA